jgi:hypothetical protein
MTSQIDDNLTLVYRNMVGLSCITTDTSGNAKFSNSLSVNSNLFVSGATLLAGTPGVSINSLLNVSGITIINSNVSLNSSLNISGATIVNGPVTFGSSLNISGSTYINDNLVISGYTIISGPTTNNSQLNVIGAAYFNNGITTNDINSTILNINAPTINIGNTNSIVNIIGTATYVASTETLIVDKLISLNVNSSTLQGSDIGMLSGIEIMGISSYGFIRTNIDATRYQIQSPLLGAPTNYITIQDSNNNLIISGTTILIGASSVNSSLNVSGLTIINGETTINNSLNVSGSTVINGSCTINNSLNISGLTVINNACSINSSLNISGITNINNATSINSSLNISGGTIINGQATISNSLSVSGTTNINNATSINSSLNVSGVTVINGPISMNSFLNVSGSSNIIGSETISSNLFVSGLTILNSGVSINSSLNVSGSSIFNSSVTIKSNLGVIGQIVAALPNYILNSDAKNGGVPVWGWYRSGGILKIRLNDVGPTISFTGGTTVSINSGESYTDPGANAVDFEGNIDPVYLTSLAVSGTSNLLSSNILISGISTLITQTSTLSSGSYTATYQATDLSGNIGFNYRLLTVNQPPSEFTPYSSSVMSFSIPTVYSIGSNPNNIIICVNNANSEGGIKPSDSFLSNQSFNYNSSWCFVILMKSTKSQAQHNIQFQINPPFDLWSTNNQGGPNPYLQILGNGILSLADGGYSYTNYNNVINALNDGMYFNVSFTYSSGGNGVIKMELVSNTGTIVNTDSRNYNYQTNNPVMPWGLYSYGYELTFNKGIYLNKTGYVPYSTYSPFFA